MSASVIQELAMAVVCSGIGLAVIYEISSLYMGWQARKTFSNFDSVQDGEIEIDFTPEDMDEEGETLSYESLVQFPMTFNGVESEYCLCVIEGKSIENEEDLLIIRLLPGDEMGAEPIEDPTEHEAAVKELERIQALPPEQQEPKAA